MISVDEVMVKNVLMLDGHLTVGETWKMFSLKKINTAPVMDNNKHLIGILTKEDILQSLFPDYRAYSTDFNEKEFDVDDNELKEVMKKRVTDIMNKNVIHTHRQTSVMRALGRMIAHRINQMPVVDDENHIVGIVTKGSIFRSLYQLHKSFFRKRSH